jgi:hypothetical protein
MRPPVLNILINLSAAVILNQIDSLLIVQRWHLLDDYHMLYLTVILNGNGPSRDHQDLEVVVYAQEIDNIAANLIFER